MKTDKSLEKRIDTELAYMTGVLAYYGVPPRIILHYIKGQKKLLVSLFHSYALEIIGKDENTGDFISDYERNEFRAELRKNL